MDDSSVGRTNRRLPKIDTSGLDISLYKSDSAHRSLHHPPAPFLPPYPPPRQGPRYGLLTLPPLLEKPRSFMKPKCGLTVQKRSANLGSKTHKKKFSNASVLVNTKETFVCFLCGSHCSTGALLYAHLTILKHDVQPNSEMKGDDKVGWITNYACRRCGRQWTNVMEGIEINQHGCVQQKAAHFNAVIMPRDGVRRGLPFICLFCCTEPDSSTAHFLQKPVTRTRAGKQPLRLYESAMRFHSKLHLVVHILCRHAIRRRGRRCAECPFVNLRLDDEEEKYEEFEFWESVPLAPSPLKKPTGQLDDLKKVTEDNDRCNHVVSSSESESDVPRPCRTLYDYSILRREGLRSLEQHIDKVHVPVFETMYWYTKQFVNKESLSKPYTCPICELNYARMECVPLTPTCNRELRGKRDKFQSNSMLQAHVACYHAGAREIETLLGVCQVCGMVNFLQNPEGGGLEQYRRAVQNSFSHLQSAGHNQRLEEQFNRCVNQGRVTSGSFFQSLDWSTVCLFCWRRYTAHVMDPYSALLAKCQLQAHIIVQHTLYSGKGEGIQHRHRDCQYGEVRPCGWCGEVVNQPCDDNRSVNSTNSPHKQFNERLADIRWQKLREQYEWYQAHELKHAEALACWWWENGATSVLDRVTTTVN
ncbi:unnamed protein product [Calicophoron daubneyi]|uniref:C2H2-type domain-containing protein n=1 Tax=Calicophoron daubneyi TaxID=300641 RepID=A0AAV2SXV4_CALDB